MPPAARPRSGHDVLRGALTHLLRDTDFNPRRAMVAVDYATLRGGWFLKHRYTGELMQMLTYAVKRTREGLLAVHYSRSRERGDVGARALRGNATDANYVPLEHERPLRMFATVKGAMNFMSGYGRARPVLVRTVGMGMGTRLFDGRINSTRADREHLAATVFQSLFRGLKSRRNMYKPPSPNNPQGGAMYRQAMRRFNASR